MKSWNAGVLGAVFAFALIVHAQAYQWPVENKTVIATFGQSVAGTFNKGIEIAGKGQQVRPLDAGELIFYGGRNQDLRELPFSSGSFAVIQHEKKLRTLYSHVDLDGKITSDEKKLFSSQDVIGETGESGNTEGAKLCLIVFDIEVNQLVNPLLLLPALEEKNRPTVRSVSLSSKDGSIPLPDNGPIPSGTWEVVAEIYDQSSYVKYFSPMAPYRFSVFLNGQETFTAAFDTLKEKDGSTRFYPSSDLGYAAFYLEEWKMRLGTVQLNKGLVNLELIVRDFAGNERSQSYRFRVN